MFVMVCVPSAQAMPSSALIWAWLMAAPAKSSNTLSVTGMMCCLMKARRARGLLVLQAAFPLQRGPALIAVLP